MFDKEMFLHRLKSNIQKGVPIIGTGVGCGLTANACEKGGADLIALYHTAMYRIAGLPTILSFLPYDNCNEMVLDALPSVRSNVKSIPLFIGLGAHDPRQSIDRLIDQAITAGIDGIVNEPFCGAYGSFIRQGLNACGLGFDAELKMLKHAITKNLLTLGWSYSEEEACTLAQAGVPLIGIIIDQNSIHVKGDITPAHIQEYVNTICEKVKKENPETFLLLHGKPLESLDSVRTALQNTQAHGFFTGSSGERYPATTGITDAIDDFHSISLK